MRAQPVSARGFTLLELVVVTAIIALLFAVALDRYLYLAERAEAAMVEQNIQAMKAGLRLALARQLMRGEPLDKAIPATHNPIEWLEEPMRGYVGAFPQEALPDCRGCWFFDTTRRELHYRPRLARHFQSAERVPSVRVWVETQDLAATAENTLTEVVWPRLTVAPYRWF